MVLKFLIVTYEIWKLKNSIRLGHQHGIQIHALIVMIIRGFHCYAAVKFNSSCLLIMPLLLQRMTNSYMAIGII